MRFPTAKKVKINEAPNHNQHNALALSFNQKIVSGLGDCSWRIFYYAFSMFRGLRNPQDTNYPAQDEWFKFYAHLEPKMTYGKFGWPEAPAGEAQGPNVANPFMAWIFGNNGKVTKADGTKDDTKDRIHGYWSEPIRLGGLEIYPPKTMPTKTSGDPNLNTVWYDSEIQRGCAAFIPDFKYLQRNALQSSTKELSLVSLGICAAARRHLRYVMETASMGNYAPSYVPDPQKKGGVFRKKNAVKDQNEQAIFYYLSYFRGVEDQRAKHNLTNKNVTVDGFDFETFFSRQFLLAPNYSQPKYELNANGQAKQDALGNNKVKYDNFGYPELFPEGIASFLWTYTVNRSDVDNVVQTANNASFSFHGDTLTQTEFNTNPNPSADKNRFCLSAIFIQSSDFAVRLTDNADALLNGMIIDIYLNGKIYESVSITNKDRYPINNRTANENNISVDRTNQYKIFQFNKIHYFKYPVKGKVSFKIRGCLDAGIPAPGNYGKLNLGLKIGSATNSNVSFFIKFAHVLEMKPSAADAYVMMRVATTEGMGSDAGQMDPVGHFNCNVAKRVFTNYIRYGVAYTLTEGKTLYQNEAYVSANPVYESVRKFINNNVKMADRNSLVDYEVDGDGNSVLYFQRYAMGMKNTGVDIFRGMGPSIDEVGNRNMIGSKAEVFTPIVKGQIYIVIDSGRNTNEYIQYCNGTSLIKYKHGSTFIGGDYYYVSKYSSQTIGVYELDGIVSGDLAYNNPKQKILVDGKKQTSPGNISNEWTMFMTYNLYHWSNSSAWKPEMYGDIMGALNARCLTSSKALENNSRTSKNVKKHLANVTWRPNDIPLVVEAPSGYNYIESANTSMQYSAWKENIEYPRSFASSCKIYQPPYQILSTTRVNGKDPRSEIIKVTLKGRLFNYHPTALKGRVSENLNAVAQLFSSDKDGVRSDENAVFDYLLHKLIGNSCPRSIIGDVSLDNQNFWSKHRPFGCCYPRFYFNKLIPLVQAGTPMYSDHYRQMEYYLRAMSNGFINKSSEMTAEEVRDIITNQNTGMDYTRGYDSAVGDYIFEDLMSTSYDNPITIPIPPNMAGTQ